MSEVFDIERLEQIPINEVVEAFGGKYYKNRGTGGRQYNMHCCNGSFHKENDKKPSLTIWSDLNICKCHVCGIKGSPIAVARKMLNDDFKEACKWLHETFGIPYKNNATLQSPQKSFQKPRVKTKKYLSFDCTKKFQKIKVANWLDKYKELTKSQRLKLVYTYIYRFSLKTDREALINYYTKRGIEKNPHLSKIGYLSEEDISKLTDKLVTMFPIENLIEFGIINDAKHKYFPLAWKQVKNVTVVPSFHLYSNLVEGFMLRPIDNTNTWFKGKESRLSVPSILKPLPFGLGYKLIRDCDDIYITEGHIDALSLPEELCFIGVPGVDAFEETQLGLLKGKNIKIAFDQDEAGQKAAWGFFEIEFDSTKMIVLKSQEEEVKALTKLLKSQNIEYRLYEHEGFRDRLIKAGVKSVKVLTWDKEFGKDLNEILLKKEIDVKKIIKSFQKSLS